MQSFSNVDKNLRYIGTRIHTQKIGADIEPSQFGESSCSFTRQMQDFVAILLNGER